MAFYDSLGLELGRVETERRITFYHIKGEQRLMLGLWETDDGAQRHFAFRVGENSIDVAPAFLADKDIELRSAFGVEPEDQSVVFLRTALASVFFYDLDGNSLELAAVLAESTELDRAPMSLHK